MAGMMDANNRCRTEYHEIQNGQTVQGGEREGEGGKVTSTPAHAFLSSSATWILVFTLLFAISFSLQSFYLPFHSH